MTNHLQLAFSEAAKLPPEQQDAIAAWLLKELESESQWDRAFEGSQDALSKLGAEALREHTLGQTAELDPESL